MDILSKENCVYIAFIYSKMEVYHDVKTAIAIVAVLLNSYAKATIITIAACLQIEAIEEGGDIRENLEKAELQIDKLCEFL